MLPSHIRMSEPATKEDLQDLKRDLLSLEQRLENFILNRELKSLRWSVGIQIAYFSITLAAVYFLLHFK
jgi:hypothetical protein